MLAGFGLIRFVVEVLMRLLTPSILWPFVGYFLTLYFLMAISYLIGRLYYHRKGALGWFVT
jgi:hypothetical protein